MADVERSTAAEVGYHLPGGPLIEQANATKTLSLADMAAFKADSLLTFCEAKGRLYFAIKDINSAGLSLHAGDLEAAARYNLKLLCRTRERGRRGRRSREMMERPAADL
jgi:hypothetical protein